jgi:hypothetical protein
MRISDGYDEIDELIAYECIKVGITKENKTNHEKERIMERTYVNIYRDVLDLDLAWNEKFVFIYLLFKAQTKNTLVRSANGKKKMTLNVGDVGYSCDYMSHELGIDIKTFRKICDVLEEKQLITRTSVQLQYLDKKIVIKDYEQYVYNEPEYSFVKG